MDLWDSLTPDHLRGDLRDIACTHGMNVARYFVEAWGGMQIWIPKFTQKQIESWNRLTPRCLPDDIAEIAQGIGMDETRRLVETWRGCFIYIPTWQSIRMDNVLPRIEQEFDGKNAGVLARKYGVARRRIYEIAQKRKQRKGEQPPLL